MPSSKLTIPKANRSGQKTKKPALVFPRPERKAAASRDLYKRRKDKGQCPRCGYQNVDSKYVWCQSCREKRRQWRRSRKSSVRREATKARAGKRQVEAESYRAGAGASRRPEQQNQPRTRQTRYDFRRVKRVIYR
ncbi:hypothetical protein F4808DRAFT_459627 [Astrocystis sublimbata]|nr:hypothetical protein F4808DRAFT_459627 [Astrocystis sublimbata]